MVPTSTVQIGLYVAPVTDVAVTTTSGIQVLRQDAGTLVAAGLTPVAGGAREIEAADLAEGIVTPAPPV